jgi:hypothetical protein
MKTIIEKLKKIHKTHRRRKGGISEHTKSAQKITKEWQEAIKSNDVFFVEVPVSPKNKEKIDVVDKSKKIAYELKVSGENTDHEFYKDIAKILTYNEYHQNRLGKLIFMSESNGIKALRKRLDPKFVALMKRKHNLEFELICI